MIAKSYQKYKILTEPYECDKKQYVKIDYPCCRVKSCSKCHGEGSYAKEVRWYDGPIEFNARNGLGFGELGYITLIHGNEEELNKYFAEEAYGKARYNVMFHWFVPSFYEMPILPEGVELKRLTWEEVSENNKVKDYSEIEGYVASLFGATPVVSSEYVGSVGDKVAMDFCVCTAKEEKGYYGTSYFYTFEGEDGNCYAWKTSAKKLNVGEIYSLKGSIKEYKTIEGTKYTILTRCREG